MRIVCVSDTHNQHGKLVVPDGDVLLHAGDATMNGTLAEVEGFNRWLGTQPHRHRVVIAGNHDWLFEKDPEAARRLITNAVYLEDASLTIDGVTFWGSPWQPWFFDWAFNLRRGPEIAAKWDLIPEGTDVLVTHGPPHGILDVVGGFLARTSSVLSGGSGKHVGCEELLLAVRRVKPKVHVFGHIHEGYGEHVEGGTRFVNASSCDAAYRPMQAPIVVHV